MDGSRRRKRKYISKPSNGGKLNGYNPFKNEGVS